MQPRMFILTAGVMAALAVPTVAGATSAKAISFNVAKQTGMVGTSGHTTKVGTKTRVVGTTLPAVVPASPVAVAPGRSLYGARPGLPEYRYRRGQLLMNKARPGTSNPAALRNLPGAWPRRTRGPGSRARTPGDHRHSRRTFEFEFESGCRDRDREVDRTVNPFGPRVCHGPGGRVTRFGSISSGRYWARTSDPQLVDSGQRSRQFAQVRSNRTVKRKHVLDRTLERTRTNAEPCHSCHAAPAFAAGARFEIHRRLRWAPVRPVSMHRE